MISVAGNAAAVALPFTSSATLYFKQSKITLVSLVIINESIYVLRSIMTIFELTGRLVVPFLRKLIF